MATVISLPRAEDELSRRVEQHWSVLQKAVSAGWIAIARDANPAVGASLDGFTDEEVLARVQALSAGTGRVDGAADPRVAEFRLFSSGRRLIGEDAPHALVHAETLDRDGWDPGREPDLRGVGSLVAVHRLREVSCLYGFTRFEPAAPATDELEDVGLAVEGAPLGRSPTWLPAVEQFGEGIFLTLDPGALAAWLSRSGLLARDTKLAEGAAAWERTRRARGLPADRAGLGERARPEYVMAHSLAHALMTEVALDCGYPASALKERVYVPPGMPARAGVLLYTAHPGRRERSEAWSR